MTAPPPADALLFDVFGTVVDWRSSIIAELTAWGSAKGIERDWAAFADSWRGLYQPSLEEVRSGRRPWTILDVLHRESLEAVLADFHIAGLTEAEKDHLNRVWHRLNPWPDALAGLARLKRRYMIGTLSNGNVGLLTRLAKHAGLPWDVILGAETARAYKPQPEAYTRNAALLNLPPDRVMLVAAHNSDLAAAAAQGLKTAFVARPAEHGPDQQTDLEPEGRWDVVARDFGELADALGCAP